MAARSLHAEASMFEEEGNTLVTVAKKMSKQMKQMAEFTRRRGPLQVQSPLSHHDLHQMPHPFKHFLGSIQQDHNNIISSVYGNH